MSRIDEIRARCDVATPGPWEDNGNEIIAVSNSKVGIAGAITDEDNTFILPLAVGRVENGRPPFGGLP